MLSDIIVKDLGRSDLMMLRNNNPNVILRQHCPLVAVGCFTRRFRGVPEVAPCQKMDYDSLIYYYLPSSDPVCWSFNLMS